MVELKRSEVLVKAAQSAPPASLVNQRFLHRPPSFRNSFRAAAPASESAFRSCVEGGMTMFSAPEIGPS
jgi:hypothetical protein